MYIYMQPVSLPDVTKKLSNQAVFTKMLYFTLASAAITCNSYLINYHELKTLINPRKEEEIELGRSFKFLIDSGLIKIQSEGVGHA